MKAIFIFSLVIGISSLAQAMCYESCNKITPVCKQLDDGSFGWWMGDYPIRDNCEYQVAQCDQVGTPDEGWYKHAKEYDLISYARCAGSKNIPVCVNVGTRSEGWQIPGSSKIIYALCAGQAVECGSQGTRSEGWMSVSSDPEPNGLILAVKCSK